MLASQNMLLFLLACCLTDHTTTMSCWRWLVKADIRQSAPPCDRLKFVCGHVLEPGKRGTAGHPFTIIGFRPATAGDSAAFCISVCPLKFGTPQRDNTTDGSTRMQKCMLSVTPHGALCKPAWPVATQPAAVRHRGLRPLGRRGAERPPSPLPHRLRECPRCFT